MSLSLPRAFFLALILIMSIFFSAHASAKDVACGPVVNLGTFWCNINDPSCDVMTNCQQALGEALGYCNMTINYSPCMVQDWLYNIYNTCGCTGQCMCPP
jgi:hypothetical protein